MTQEASHIDPMLQSAAEFSRSASQQMAAGPSGLLDLVVAGVCLLVVVVFAALVVKYFIRPRPQENDPDHIKNRILHDDF